MSELHLIGFTEDVEHLVLDDRADGAGRHLLAIDPDLLATLAHVRELRVVQGLPVDHRPGPEPAPAAAPDPAAVAAPDPAVVAAPVPAPAAPHPTLDAGLDGRGLLPGSADPDVTPPVPSALDPAAIQARLRAGRSVRAVAEEAGTDRAWIERWLPPVLAERDRIVAEARRRRMVGSRARPLGAAVERGLAERGVDPETASWVATRRGDGRWRVTVRFEQGVKLRTATWLLELDGERVEPAGPLAERLGAPSPLTRRRR